MRVDNDGVGIEYQVTGDGRPVVLIHGFPDSARLWRYQVPALAEAGFKVIVPDMRGYGGSDRPSEVDAYRLTRLAGDVLAVIADAGVAEEWLTANDWSNFREWGRHPDEVGAIADLEANGSLTPGLNYYRANIPPQSFLPGGIALPRVQAPTMGVWSSGDFALTEGQMTSSAANVAGPWRHERLDGPGHWMQLEAPSEVNRLLIDFLPA